MFRDVYKRQRFRGGDATAGGAGEESQLNEVGLVDVFDRLAFLACCGGYRLDADGTAAELVDHGREDMSVSYTHLDVYKRQVLTFVRGYFQDNFSALAEEE